MTIQGVKAVVRNDKYAHIKPLPDPPKEPDMQQNIRLQDFASIVRYHFDQRDDVVVAGEGYLRFNGDNDDERFVPDCVVTFGVDPGAVVARNGYVINEVGKPPDFVIEVASKSTGRRDYTVKRRGYANYGVREYWRFDHTGGDFHDAALAGDILVDGRYEPLDIHHEPDGLIWGYSPMLGLDICWDGGRIRLRVPDTGEFVPVPEEAARRNRAEAARADAAEAEAAVNAARASAAEAEAVVNAVRASAVEAENAMLREQIRRMREG